MLSYGNNHVRSDSFTVIRHNINVMKILTIYVGPPPAFVPMIRIIWPIKVMAVCVLLHFERLQVTFICTVKFISTFMHVNHY